MTVIKNSRHVELHRQINQKLLVGRKKQPPEILRGRQIIRTIITFFETERGKGVTDRYEDLFNLVLIDGYEQEFLDRWDGILRDIGDPPPPEDLLRARFHLHCIQSTMMKIINEKWDDADSDIAYRDYTNLR